MSSTTSSRPSSRMPTSGAPRPGPAPSSRPSPKQRKDLDTLHVSLGKSSSRSKAPSAEGSGRRSSRSGPGPRTPLSPTRSIASNSSQAPLLSNSRHHPYPTSPRQIPNCDSGSSWRPPQDWSAEMDEGGKKSRGNGTRKDGKGKKVEFSREERERILEHHRRIVEACKVLGL